MPVLAQQILVFTVIVLLIARYVGAVEEKAFLRLIGTILGGVLGTFPSPVLGGRDDGDALKNGRHVPTMSWDQVGATLMQWLGLDAAQFHDVFPNLVNFPTKTVPLLRA